MLDSDGARGHDLLTAHAPDLGHVPTAAKEATTPLLHHENHRTIQPSPKVATRYREWRNVKRTRKTAIGLALAVVVSFFAIFGVFAYEKFFNASTVTMGKAIPLTEGSGPNGERWQLVARVEHKHHSSGDKTRLCLNLIVGGEQSAGGCEFDARPSYGYWSSGKGPGYSNFFLGPVPTNATQVRLAGPGLKTYVVPTSPLPAMKGIPQGRYFIVDSDPDGSVTARNDGRRYWTVTPLDAHGRSVSFRDF
ncbi:hypothetical protein GCM10029978_114580 [Actinoallomurus acanthiterrae]